MRLLFNLALTVFILVSSAAGECVCIVKSYSFDVINGVVSDIVDSLEQKNIHLLSLEKLKRPNRNCDKLVLLGTPAVVKSRDICSKGKLCIYSFVLFPEELNLKGNFTGIRIFPLPKRTVDVFSKFTGLKPEKVALLAGERTEEIARKQVKGDRRFRVFIVKDDVNEVLDKLQNYRFVYLFPDPVVMKVSNLLKLLDFTSLRGIITISNMPETEKFGVNFIYGADYQALSRRIVSILKDGKPKKSILDCPAKVYVWRKSEAQF